ncbi:DUF6090 family protein [Lutimonas zeaxanthinifaciens]|uniref:DUF6090 family protein n=1 Tax=Lutimonas zeaxanthinifaciens TaxID=3060215 RepID=UPI00265D0A7C|nr:DUF6090 family protein [Lutimonas sp. YSD2104]WKK65703.1 DUF6090 family protein [Lutimonas sp. YSD2104]
MIPFFRKIRKKLSADNQFLKYSRYAIGEIVLVVVGILIALQINNLNEDRKEKIQENKILANLKDEFQENYQNLKYKDSILKITIKNLETVFDELHEKEKSYRDEELDNILSLALGSPTWVPSEFILNDLKSSGNLTKLQNDRLKKLLYEWSRFFSELDETQKMIEDSNTQLINYIKNNGSLRNIDINNASFNYEKSQLIKTNDHLLLDPIFENYVDDKLYVLNEALKQFKQAEELILEILDATASESE